MNTAENTQSPPHQSSVQPGVCGDQHSGPSLTWQACKPKHLNTVGHLGYGNKLEPHVSPWPRGACALLGCRGPRGHTQTHQQGQVTGRTLTGSDMVCGWSLTQSLNDKPRRLCKELGKCMLKNYQWREPFPLSREENRGHSKVSRFTAPSWKSWNGTLVS